MLNYLMGLIFEEDLYFRKWSVPYLLFTPSFIENIPRPQPKGEPIYHSSSGDGPKPPSAGVHFWTTATRAQVFTEINEYLIKNGYTQVYDNLTYNHEYSKGNNRFGLRISGDALGSVEVVAEEMYF
jgi:hypothetical protein